MSSWSMNVSMMVYMMVRFLLNPHIGKDIFRWRFGGPARAMRFLDFQGVHAHYLQNGSLNAQTWFFNAGKALWWYYRHIFVMISERYVCNMLVEYVFRFFWWSHFSIWSNLVLIPKIVLSPHVSNTRVLYLIHWASICQVVNIFNLRNPTDGLNEHTPSQVQCLGLALVFEFFTVRVGRWVKWRSGFLRVLMFAVWACSGDFQLVESYCQATGWSSSCSSHTVWARFHGISSHNPWVPRTSLKLFVPMTFRKRICGTSLALWGRKWQEPNRCWPTWWWRICLVIPSIFGKQTEIPWRVLTGK